MLSRLADSPYFAPDAGDMKFYNDWALRILGGQLTDGRAFYGLPGYAFFLAGIYRVAGPSPYLIGLLQAIAEAFTSVLLWRIAREVFPSFAEVRIASSVLRFDPAKIIGISTALGWAFFQPAQTFSVILMPTAWLVAVFWFCVWRMLATRHFSLWKPWLGLGLLIGVMAMIVATILFLLPLMLVAIARLGLRENKRIPAIAGAALVFLAAVCAGVLPCWIHNRFVAGEPVTLSAHSGINFYIGNNPIANGYPKIPPGMRAGQAGMLQDSITMAEAGAGRPLKRYEVSEFWSEKARTFLREQPAAWLRLMGTKFLNFWNTYQYDDLSLITLFATSNILTPGLRFGFVAALALPGMIFAARRHPRARWVIAAILLHMVALLPVFVTERYRLAAAPGLMLMAAFGLWELWRAILEARWSFAGAYAGLSLLGALFVSWPQNDPGLWSLDFYNTGVKAIDAGRLDLAQRNLEIAHRYVPENSEINFALGNLWLQKDDPTRAKAFYRRAIEINPWHANAFNNLGVLAMGEQRWELAEKFLAQAAHLEPEDAKTHFLLAKTRLLLGNVAGAQESIQQALWLDPRPNVFHDLAAEIRARSESRVNGQSSPPP